MFLKCLKGLLSNSDGAAAGRSYWHLLLNTQKQLCLTIYLCHLCLWGQSVVFLADIFHGPPTKKISSPNWAFSRWTTIRMRDEQVGVTKVCYYIRLLTETVCLQSVNGKLQCLFAKKNAGHPRLIDLVEKLLKSLGPKTI